MYDDTKTSMNTALMLIDYIHQSPYNSLNDISEKCCFHSICMCFHPGIIADPEYKCKVNRVLRQGFM